MSDPPDAVPEVKGVSFHNYSTSMKRLCDAATFSRFRAAIPTTLRAQLDSGELLKMGWYPLEQYKTLHAATLAATTDGLELAFAVGREGTHADFNGIYRLLRFILTPQTLIQRAPAVFGRYRRPGVLVIEEARDGFARARFDRCFGCNAALWQEISGGCVAVLEVCGAVSVHATITESAVPGQAIFEARWTHTR